MSKILMVVLPLKGHMHSIMKLAKSLRERGHEVLFAGMEDCGPLVEVYGFEFIPIFSDWFPRGFMQEWLRGPTSRKSWKDNLRFYLDERRKMIDHERFVEYLIEGGSQEFKKAVAGIAPDLLLIDIDLHAYWALMAYQSGVKSLYVSTVLPTEEHPVIPPFNSLLQPAGDVSSRINVRLAWNRYFAARWLRSRAMNLAGIPASILNIKRLARACGYPLNRLNVRTMLFPQLDMPALILCPEEFEFPEARQKPNVRYIEAAIDINRSKPTFPSHKIESDKKLVFCSLGSVAYNHVFFQNVIDAVAREPEWQLVMNIGPALSRADFARVPENAILINDAPQIEILERAHAMINHGGISSVKECVYFGVPQVVFPIGFDQPGAAARVLYHGLGVVGDFREATVEAVHSLLSQVLQDERFRSRSRAMSQVFKAKEEQKIGAAVIERFLAS